jgi:hypothetical protein
MHSEREYGVVRRATCRTGRDHARTAHDLALVAKDPENGVTALLDMAILAAYAGDHQASARREAERAALVASTSSATGRAYLAYVRGECGTEHGGRDAARHLREAAQIARDADAVALARLITRAGQEAR